MERAALRSGQAAARSADTQVNRPHDNDRREMEFVPRVAARMVRLPGEFLQAQMEG